MAQVWVVFSFFIMYSKFPIIIVFKFCITNKHNYLKFPGSCGLSRGDLKPSPGLGMRLKAFFQPCQSWAQLDRDLDPGSTTDVHALRDTGSFIYREHCVPGPDCPLTPAAAVWTEPIRGAASGWSQCSAGSQPPLAQNSSLRSILAPEYRAELDFDRVQSPWGGYRASSYGFEKRLELGSGDGCTALWMEWVPLNCAFENDSNSQLYGDFCHNFFKVEKKSSCGKKTKGREACPVGFGGHYNRRTGCKPRSHPCWWWPWVP